MTWLAIGAAGAILYFGAMVLLGVAVENRRVWGIAAITVLAIILFAGFTSWP